MTEDDPNYSIEMISRTKDEVVKNHPKKRRRGRPSLIEINGNQNLANEAIELRKLGLSWSKIANELGISRTSARRLCQKSQEVCQNSEE